MNTEVHDDTFRSWAYLVVALAAFCTGVILGQLRGPVGDNGSRIEWPHSVR